MCKLQKNRIDISYDKGSGNILVNNWKKYQHIQCRDKKTRMALAKLNHKKTYM